MILNQFSYLMGPERLKLQLDFSRNVEILSVILNNPECIFSNPQRAHALT